MFRNVILARHTVGTRIEGESITFVPLPLSCDVLRHRLNLLICPVRLEFYGGMHPPLLSSGDLIRIAEHFNPCYP